MSEGHAPTGEHTEHGDEEKFEPWPKGFIFGVGKEFWEIPFPANDNKHDDHNAGGGGGDHGDHGGGGGGPVHHDDSADHSEASHGAPGHETPEHGATGHDTKGHGAPPGAPDTHDKHDEKASKDNHEPKKDDHGAAPTAHSKAA